MALFGTQTSGIPTDGKTETLFNDISRSESIPWHITFDLEAPNTGEPITDMTCWQVFVSYNQKTIDCDTPNIEIQLELIPGELLKFYGVVTDEDTFNELIAGKDTYGAIKTVDPDGNSIFHDKAKLQVFPCRNPRLDLEP